MKSIFMVTMEYSGVAEAGGVKLVARSLCEELHRQGFCVTVIMPRFGCTDMSALCRLQEGECKTEIQIDGKRQKVSFDSAHIIGEGGEGEGTKEGGDVKCILVCSPCFAEKGAVYTYTEDEEARCPEHKKGTGHLDSRLMDSLLCKSAAFIVERAVQDGTNAPNIVLCEDAACALAPVYIKEALKGTGKSVPSIVTIHNAGAAYHHEFSSLEEAQRYTGLSKEVLCGAFNGRTVEPYLLAAGCATLTTVSSQYAAELNSAAGDDITDRLSSAFRTRSIEVKGILNGIDYGRYDPAGEKSLLPYKFDAAAGDFAGKRQCKEYVLKKYFGRGAGGEKDVVLFCYHGRLVQQKGIRVLCPAVKEVLLDSAIEGKECLFIAMGQGEKELEDMMSSLQKECTEAAVYIKGYDKALSRLVIAASDFAILPSISEPCGQEDYIAQIYGTLPIAHATGGLKKIEDGKTGFLYSPNTAEALACVLRNIIDMKKERGQYFADMAKVAAQSVRDKHSWQVVLKDGYLPLFRDIAGGGGWE